MVARFRKYLEKQRLSARTMTPEAVAKKHGVSVGYIMAQLKKGIEIEKEHSSDPRIAREVALDHLGEDENYYKKLIKMERGGKK